MAAVAAVPREGVDVPVILQVEFQQSKMYVWMVPQSDLLLCSGDVYPQCKQCRRPLRSHSTVLGVRTAQQTVEFPQVQLLGLVLLLCIDTWYGRRPSDLQRQLLAFPKDIRRCDLEAVVMGFRLICAIFRIPPH